MKNKLEFAKQIVLEAGEYIRQHLDDSLKIMRKTGPTDLVTQMDQQVQKDLVEKITRRYPTDQILRRKTAFVPPFQKDLFG